MVWRMIIRFILQRNPYYLEQLTQRLSESYPIRRAAQLTAYVFYKGQTKVKSIQNGTGLTGLNLQERLKSFGNTFKSEYEKEMKKLKK